MKDSRLSVGGRLCASLSLLSLAAPLGCGANDSGGATSSTGSSATSTGTTGTGGTTTGGTTTGGEATSGGATSGGATGGTTTGSAGGTNATGAGGSTTGAGATGGSAMGGAGGAPVLTIPDGIIEVEIPDQEDCENAYPHDPSVDEETGLVYWAGSNESCIGEFNPDTMEFRAWPTATADSYPHGLDVGPDGFVYYTGRDVDRIGRVNPDSGMTEDFSVEANGPHTPVFHQGSLWFTAQSGGQFGVLDPETGDAEVYDFSAGNTGPYGIWPAPDGSLWVALFGTNRLARIDTSATPPTAEEFVLPNAGSRPRRIAVDSEGMVWYTDYPRRMLGRMDPTLPEDERFAEWPTPGGGQPYGLVIGPDGRVWYNDQDASEIVGFDQATESVIAQLPLELENTGPVRNIDVDRTRNRIWISVSNIGRLGMLQF